MSAERFQRLIHTIADVWLQRNAEIEHFRRETERLNKEIEHRDAVIADHPQDIERAIQRDRVAQGTHETVRKSALELIAKIAKETA